jgi:hypothetical protein
MLQKAAQEGHTYLAQTALAMQIYKLLNEAVPPALEKAIARLKVPREKDRLYLPDLYNAEVAVADFFKNHIPPPPVDPSPYLRDLNLNLSPEQEKAVYAAFKHGTAIITVCYPCCASG